MNRNRLEGNWKQFKGVIKGKWGKLTGDRADQIAGKGEELAGKVQETYGATQDAAEKQVEQFEERSKD